MRNLLTKQNKHLLWQDELGDSFLFLKYAEVFRYSETELRLHIWGYKKLFQLRKMGVILEEIPTDDQFHIINVKTSNLPLLIDLGGFRKRPNIHGKWIKKMEVVLAHKILPFNPKLS